MTLKNKKPKIISIIGGTGQMGQMFAKAFQAKGYEVLIAGRKTELTFKEVAEKGDLVIVCVPISATEKVIKEVGPFVRKEAILSDFTSVKTLPCQAMISSSKSQVVGAHPVFGPIPDLKGQSFVICPERVSKTSLSWYKSLFQSLELNVIEMTAEAHDRQMAVVQCLNHLSNLSFANAIKNLKFDLKNKELFSPAFVLKLNLIKRMLAQSSSLYAEIETYNPYAGVIAKNYLASLNEIKKDIDNRKKDLLENKIKKIQTYFDILNQTSEVLTEKVPNLNKKKETFSGQLAILGPAFSHSHLLAEQVYPRKSFLFCSNIEEVFRLVFENKISNGIVPIENMLNGGVKESILALRKYKIKINHLYHFPIHHCFASKTLKFTKIISHSQAIAQCSKFLEIYKKSGIEVIETTSTSKALEIAATDSDYAAIGSLAGAKHFDLKVIKDKIENNHNNVTSFIAISKKETPIELNTNVRTSILVIPPQDHSGLLYEVLSSFKQNKINLTKIESIPTGEKIGEYIFYIELDGNIKNHSVRASINALEALYNIYLLGSYPVENLNI
jgi:prephenate dehydratase/prephenate dehydrogenase